MINQFGKMIRDLRNINRLRQNQVAGIIGIDTPLLCKIEKGERIANRSIIPHLAEIFHTNEDKLVIAWLADQLIHVVKDESTALEAISYVRELVQIENN